MQWKFWNKQEPPKTPKQAIQIGTRSEALKVIIDIAKLEVASQANAFDQLDTKTGVALGFVLVAITQIVVALFRLAADGTPIRTTHPTLAIALVTIAVTCFALSTALGLLQRLSVGFDIGPGLSDVISKPSEAEVLLQAVQHFEKAIETNDDVIEKKANRADGCAILGIVGMFLVVTLVVLLFFAVPPPEAKQAPPGAAFSLDGYQIPPRSLSVSYSAYRQQMGDCSKDVTGYSKQIRSGSLKRNDKAVLDLYDVALIRANTCIAWATEPLPPEAQNAVEASTQLGMDVAEHFRYKH